MPRPKKENKKSARFELRVTPDEKEQLQKSAKKFNMSVAEFVLYATTEISENRKRR